MNCKVKSDDKHSSVMKGKYRNRSLVTKFLPLRSSEVSTERYAGYDLKLKDYKSQMAVE